MSNRKKIASIVFTGAAGAAVTMMGAAPPAAAAGNTKNSVTTWRTQLKPGTSEVLVDVTRNTTLACQKGVASGTLSVSSFTPPARVGFMRMATWSSCTGPFGLTLKEHLARPANYSVITTTRSSHGGVISATGRIGGLISLKISGTGLAAHCKATFSGTSIPWRWRIASPSTSTFNSGHKVTLRVRSAANCLGVINPGDKAYFAATYISVS